MKIRIYDKKIGFNRSKRVTAEYVGKYKRAILCVRVDTLTDDFICFEVCTGREISSDFNKLDAINKAINKLDKIYKSIEELIMLNAQLYKENILPNKVEKLYQIIERRR